MKQTYFIRLSELYITKFYLTKFRLQNSIEKNKKYIYFRILFTKFYLAHLPLTSSLIKRKSTLSQQPKKRKYMKKSVKKTKLSINLLKLYQANLVTNKSK